jgi:hypothetical protein
MEDHGLTAVGDSSGRATMICGARDGEPRHALAAVIAGDERGLRRLAELLAPYLPAPVAASEDRWMDSREAAASAGTTRDALHKAMAAREVHFEQDTPGGKAWFRRADIDAWRRGERPPSAVRRAA